MRHTYRVPGRCTGAASVVVLVALLCVPATSVASRSSASGGEPAVADSALLARGAGFDQPHGSARVRALQRQLRAAGHEPGPVDGLFGPLTEAAVERFQLRSGLRADGIVGPLTARALRAASHGPLARGAGYGARGGSPRVRRVQRRLRALGERPGPIDGLFGPRTEAAVKRFEQESRLRADGIVGPRTSRAFADARHGVGKTPTQQAGKQQPSPRKTRRPARPAAGGQATHGAGNHPSPAEGANRNNGVEDRGQGHDLLPWLLLVGGLGAFAVAALVVARRSRGRAPRRRVVRPGALGETAAVAGLAALPRRVLTVGRRPSRASHPADQPTRREPPSRAPKPQPIAPWVEGHSHREPRPRAESSANGESAGRVPQAERFRFVAEQVRGSDLSGSVAGTGAVGNGVLALGYVSVPDEPTRAELRAQVAPIAALCRRHGWRLLDVARDVEHPERDAPARPGLAYALQRLAAGHASCLVVAEVRRLSRSVAALGELVDWFIRRGVRLVVLDIELDTATRVGQAAAEALVSVGARERELGDRGRREPSSERFKRGATGRPAVEDIPALQRYIATLRSTGMTLQAIADRLNAEGVPTVRGGREWRPSSVQAAVGYRRPRQRREQARQGGRARGDSGGGS